MKLKRSAGVLLHPTSLPGPYGIGDLNAFEFIDFLAASNQTLWQVLPLGPTSYGDSPYQSFSTFAGNTLLISPDILIKKGYLNEVPIHNFDTHKVDYARVIEFKTELFKCAFENFKAIDSKHKRRFNAFCEQHSDWLDDYCLFISLKEHFIAERKDLACPDDNNDYFYGAVWTTWPQDILSRDRLSIQKYSKLLSERIAYHKFLQFEFFEQWKELRDYANSKNVSIIGDIPIFVAFDSADVWTNPNLFQLNLNYCPKFIAGVPPDYFSATGQLWGNPLYEWDYNKKTNYAWWIKRFKHTLQNVDIIRIDHFRGFESYWSVPYGEDTAVNGKWCKGPGKSFFDAIEKALGKIPIIAEDLGIITDEVANLRDDCGFPGMKILQFAFDDGDENNHLPHDFQTSNLVAYTGTHDNDTVVGWYNNAPEKYRDKFRRYMNVSGDDPAWELIRLLYASVAAYAIVPIQDLMALNSCDRMNTPGIASGNWQFRFTKQMLSDDIKTKLTYLTDLFDR